MRRILTRTQAGAYRRRWRMLERSERDELRSAPVDLKFRQMQALFASRDLFGPDPLRAKEDAALRERWAFLRKRLRG